MEYTKSDSDRFTDNKDQKMKGQNAHARSFGGHRILLSKLSYQTFVRRCTEEIKETIFQKPFIHLLREKGYTLLKPHSIAILSNKNHLS